MTEIFLLIHAPLFPDTNAERQVEHRMRWETTLPPLLLSLLSHLSNVESLHLEGGRLLSPTNPARVGHHIVEIPLLLHLRNLYISPASNHDQLVNIAEHTPFFFHPGLQNLYLQNCAASSITRAWNLTTLQPASIRIASISILQCFIDQTSLQLFLAACSALKILKFQLYKKPHNVSVMRAHLEHEMGVQQPLTPEEFSAALQIRADTLEEVCMDFRWKVGDGWGLPSSVWAIGSLRAFERLRRVEMECTEAVHTVIKGLPASLEYFTLIRVRAKYLGDMYAHLLDDKLDRLPRLVAVRLEALVYPGENWEGEEFVRDAIRLGTWVGHEGSKGKCCFELTAKGVIFTLCNPLEHEEGERNWRDGYDVQEGGELFATLRKRIHDP
jgi:hypothetical protein